MIIKSNMIYRKYIIMFLVFILAITFFSNTVMAAEEDYNPENNPGFGIEDDDEKPNILIRVLTWAFRFVNKLIYSALDKEAVSIDALVFNKEVDGEGSELVGLAIFKPGPVQDFIATFYNLFQYIAIAMFAPIVLWTGVYFSRAGDNVQQRSLLKDRIFRVLMSTIFLYAMPEFVTAVSIFSNSLVDLFGQVGSSFLDAANTNEIIAEYINNNSGSITETITGLMLIGTNIWLIGFYTIRNLTVCLLFIIFPVIAIFYPSDKGMVNNWWRNMLGNILAQPIQAVVLALVLALASMFKGGLSFVRGLLLVFGFASIVPMTATIKGFLGLEGHVGAAYSRAGLGGLFHTIALTSRMMRGMGRQIDEIKEGADILANAKVQEKGLEKNISTNNALSSSSRLGMVENLPNFNLSAVDNATQYTQYKDNSLENMEIQKRMAKRQIAKGVGSLATSTFTGLTGAAVGAGFGGLGGAVAFSAIGSFASKGVGSAIGGGLYGSYDWFKQSAQYQSDISNLQFELMNEDINSVRQDQMNEILNSDLDDVVKNSRIQELQAQLSNNSSITADEFNTMKHYYPNTYNKYRTMAENRYFGLDNAILNNTQFQAQERIARKTQMMWQNRGVGAFATYMANKSYTDLTPARKNPEELSMIDNAYLYQDSNASVVYTMNDQGSVDEILFVGGGNADLSAGEIVDVPVHFSSSEIEVPQYKMYEINMEAREDAKSYLAQYYPQYEEGSPEYNRVFTERERYYKQNLISNFKNRVQVTRGNIGSFNLNYKENPDYLEYLKKDAEIREKMKEYRNLQRELAKQTYQEDIKGTNYIPNLDNMQ